MPKLTIPDEETVAVFTVTTANDTFPFTFAIFEKADLRLRVDADDELTQGDFTLNGTLLDGGGYQGGEIVLNDPVASCTLRVWRDIRPQRSENFGAVNSVPVSAVDLAVSRQMAVSQDLKRDQEVVLEAAPYLADLPATIDSVFEARDEAVAATADKADRVLGNLTDVEAAFENIGGPAYISEQFNSREASVLSMDDWDATGGNDNAASYQTLIDQAADDGVPVKGVGGLSALGETIVLPPGHTFEGYSGAPAGVAAGNAAYDPRHSSNWLIGHTGVGFTSTGRYDAGIVVRDMITRREQPDPGPGWEPNDHDYDFYFDDESDIAFERVHMHNATRGIYANGDRLNFRDITGQFFVNALRVESCYDVIRASGWQAWAYWSQHDAVKAFQIANTDAIRLSRIDNPQFSGMFGIWGRRFLSIEQYAGDGPSRPAGTVNRLRMMQGDADSYQTLLYVHPDSVGARTLITGFLTQGPDTPSSSPQIDIQGTYGYHNLRDLECQLAGGSIIKVTGAHNRVLAEIESAYYNMNDIAAPAIKVTATTSKVTLRDGTRISQNPVTINGTYYPVHATAIGGPLADGLILGDGNRETAVYLGSTIGGTGFVASGTMNYQIGPDGMVDWTAKITCTTVGDAGGGLAFGLPYLVSKDFAFAGRTQNGTGYGLAGQCVEGTALALVVRAGDNAFPLVDGTILVISGRYRAAIFA